MATKLYFHAAAATVPANLTFPTTTQSGLTITSSVDAQSVNRTMTTNKGTSQTSLVLTSSASVSTLSYYFTRFCSPPLYGDSASGTLGAPTIVADTWTFSFAASENNANANFPTTTSGTGPCCCYVWRPSTGAKVGNILISASGMGTISEAGTTETALSGTFSGSAVTVQPGDIICFEVVFTTTQGTATARTDTFFYDGTTEANTASCASFINSPNNTLTFGSTMSKWKSTTYLG